MSRKLYNHIIRSNYLNIKNKIDNETKPKKSKDKTR